MNSQLITHHPYRSLTELQPSFPLASEEYVLANAIIHDHYLTDLPLLYAPHVIAVTAVILAVALRQQNPSSMQPHAAAMTNALQSLGNPTPRIAKLIDFLAESSIDIAAVVDATQELISLYEVWDNFQEKACKEQISRFVKGRGLDK